MRTLPRMKNRLKKAFAFLLYHTGIAERQLQKKSDGCCIVLMYHRVLPEKERAMSWSHDGITISTTAFESQMAYIARSCTPISIGDLDARLQHGKAFAPKTILVTFDDGWQDNYRHALPILGQYKIPALIFLSSGFVGTDRSFWQERLMRLIWTATRQTRSETHRAKELAALFGATQVRLLLASKGEQLRSRILALVQGQKSKPYEEIEAVLQRLEAVCRQAPEKCIGNGGGPDFLSWDQVREMRDGGIDFGSHGVNHLILDKAGVDVDGELQRSKRDIEAQIQDQVAAFSYPNGNYNASIAKKVAAYGYRLGFGTRFGLNSLTTDRFALKRVNIFQDATSTLPLFTGRILGYW
jgi:peptidoglycan/xylan/chitin deacetylase (PgdA/CDA1 family)